MNVHLNVFIDIKELKLNEHGIKIIIGTVSQKSPIYIKNSTTFYKIVLVVMFIVSKSFF